MRKLILWRTFCAIALVALFAAWFTYKWYSARPHVRWSYWSPAVQQVDDMSVLGEGTTILAKPEKDPHDAFPGEVIGRPLKVTITPTAFERKYVSLRFSALTDYEVVFRPPFYSHLISVLDEYEALKSRVKQQKRLAYTQELASIPYMDTRGTIRQIRVSLRSSPQKSVVSRGFASDEGQTIYLRLELPFPLEQSSNFDHTEVAIPDNGVQHLRRILQKFIRSVPTPLQTV